MSQLELPLLEQVEVSKKELPHLDEAKPSQVELRHLDEVELPYLEQQQLEELDLLTQLERLETKELLVALAEEVLKLLTSHQPGCLAPFPVPKAWARSKGCTIHSKP